MVDELGVDQVVTMTCGFYPDPDVSAKVWMDGDIIHKTYSTPSESCTPLFDIMTTGHMGWIYRSSATTIPLILSCHG